MIVSGAIGTPLLWATRVLPCAILLVAKSSTIGGCAGARNADAERVGAEARVAAAERRDDRPRQHVDEVDRHQPCGRALLGPVADAAEVMRVREPDDADAVALRALDAELHRLAADHLAVALAAVEGQQRAAVEHDADMLR